MVGIGPPLTVMAELFRRNAHTLDGPRSPMRRIPGLEPATGYSAFAELRTPHPAERLSALGSAVRKGGAAAQPDRRPRWYLRGLGRAVSRRPTPAGQPLGEPSHLPAGPGHGQSPRVSTSFTVAPLRAMTSGNAGKSGRGTSPGNDPDLGRLRATGHPTPKGVSASARRRGIAQHAVLSPGGAS